MSSSDTVTFPFPFVPGFMGFETEHELMLDFHASCRDAGLKRYAQTYKQLCDGQTRPAIEPSTLVPAIAFPNEGGDDIVINGEIRSASAMAGKGGSNGTYEGPADMAYAKKFGKVPGTRSGRGFVHAMSEAQKRFILRLLSTKDTSVIANNLVKGWTLDPNEIDSISKQHARPFIDALLSCPDKKAANDSDRKELTGSPRQIEWITKGLNGKASLLSEKGILTESDIKAFFTKHNYNAKQIIDALLKMPKVVTKKDSVTKEELTEGMYIDGERIFKVYMNQSMTCMLTKELLDGHFEYLGSAQWKLPKTARRMTLDEAKAYGKVTGTCCVCGRRLTNESSIEAGIGPVCEANY